MDREDETLGWQDLASTLEAVPGGPDGDAAGGAELRLVARTPARGS